MNEENKNMNNQPVTPLQKSESEGVGPLVGAVIVILIIALGGVYFLSKKVEEVNDDGVSGEEIMQEQDMTTLGLQTQQNSDEIADIEADLNATDLEDLDRELENIDGELSL